MSPDMAKCHLKEILLSVPLTDTALDLTIAGVSHKTRFKAFPPSTWPKASRGKHLFSLNVSSIYLSDKTYAGHKCSTRLQAGLVQNPFITHILHQL